MTAYLNMKPHQIARILAVGFFTVWLGILYAGADHPPPMGFLWLVLFDAVAAGLIYIRTPLYIRWSISQKKNRGFHVLLDGVTAGLLFALVATLMPGTGEPSSPQPGWVDYVIWCGVLTVVGAANAFAVFFFSALSTKK